MISAERANQIATAASLGGLFEPSNEEESQFYASVRRDLESMAEQGIQAVIPQEWDEDHREPEALSQWVEVPESKPEPKPAFRAISRKSPLAKPKKEPKSAEINDDKSLPPVQRAARAFKFAKLKKRNRTAAKFDPPPLDDE